MPEPIMSREQFFTSVKSGGRPTGVIANLGFITWRTSLNEKSVPTSLIINPVYNRKGLTYYSETHIAEITPIVEKDVKTGKYEILSDYSKVQTATVIPLPPPALPIFPVGGTAGYEAPRITSQDLQRWSHDTKMFMLAMGMATYIIGREEYFTWKDLFLNQATGTSREAWNNQQKREREAEEFARLQGIGHKTMLNNNISNPPPDGGFDPKRPFDEIPLGVKVVVGIGLGAFLLKSIFYPEEEVVDKNKIKSLEEKKEKLKESLENGKK
ncbi:hypothetical protein [Dysgonomonas sp. ZJ709]|uniref:hypothetical protein n=1 Tax=Dysgonomonas sp. ZJ709 TaxID=2709797 RepID=UPI0013EB25B3|nr:hypothetical protein [Dysgonomonas sp. ZJ709]